MNTCTHLWSVLLCFMPMWMVVGAEWLSRAISESETWQPGSYSADEGAVNSAALRKPKYPKLQASDSVAASGSSVSSQLWGFFVAVIGSLGFNWAFFFALLRFRTYTRRGMDWLANGSPLPEAIWAWRIPERWHFVLEGVVAEGWHEIAEDILRYWKLWADFELGTKV